ncbi:hypothetical protein N7508_006607 [Penicillium antarcticum]|uniref:uncharacterized protein n=1 Tax=Penicillium antarcticum TaxID=416450 RepID=UPI00239A43D6|nr:uncharacterized protein N7508_006607 [Penicillium antarcticum]KAJ5301744.1 hypothetical protein N7508_006607 [Penicillium antarcticum]
MKRFSLLFLFYFCHSTLADTCYWPNGKAAPDNWMPCPGSKHCCASGEACLSNNLCIAGKYMTVYRGACTDKSWPISECPRICYEEIDGGWANLYPCPTNNNEVFTCGGSGWSSSVCDAQLGNFTWVESNVTVAQLGIPTSSSAVSSATATSSTSQSTDTSTSQTSSTVLTSGSPEECESPLGAELGIGLGIGAPLAIAAVTMFWLYMRTRRQMQVLQQRLNEKGGNLQSAPPVYQSPPRELDAEDTNWPKVYRSELS